MVISKSLFCTQKTVCGGGGLHAKRGMGLRCIVIKPRSEEALSVDSSATGYIKSPLKDGELASGYLIYHFWRIIEVLLLI